MAVASPYAVFKAAEWAWPIARLAAPAAPLVMVASTPQRPQRKPQKRLSTIVQGELFPLA